jgi:hypothetical protein
MKPDSQNTHLLQKVRIGDAKSFRTWANGCTGLPIWGGRKKRMHGGVVVQKKPGRARTNPGQ